MSSPTALPALLAAAWLFAPPAAATDALQEAIHDAAIALRSIDADDEDFSDLEPLVAAIGGARVVLLGEPSHGAGGAFAAKARLVRLLHQRMGFDVVAWESGLHGLNATESALNAREDPGVAARRGIFSIWSGAQQLRPLFEYAARTRESARPLLMAGFDIQFTAPGAVEYLAKDLREFFSALDDAGLRRQMQALGEDMFAALARLRARPQPPVTTITISVEHRDAVLRAADKLLALLRAPPPAVSRAHAPVRIAMLERSLANLREDASTTYDRRRTDRPRDASRLTLQSAGWNRRDGRMAANLRWLLEELHRGRKIIVWGHNAHLMRAHFAIDWTGVIHEPANDGMSPMGALLSATLKDDMYSIGFTTFDGEDGWANGQKHDTIAPAPPGSLEAMLHAIGRPWLFLDLHAVSRRLGGAAAGPLSMRISGYGPPTSPHGNDVVPDLARAFDAVFFIDRMTPAVAIPGR